ncbi:MAG: hypothetical protein MAG794_01292 [Gammaproteobacteria bacterium]|nr:hypothetical protein [Gammaproteobacteria bacterium]
MTSAREDILDRVRTALGRDRISSDTRTKLDRRLSDPPSYERPGLGEDRVHLFATRLTAVRGGFRKTDSGHVMESIADCLDRHGLERAIIAAPALEHLSWPADWNVSFGASRGDDRVSVTPCFAAVAETGSVVLLSGPDSPTSLNFLPEYHIVLVRAEQLLDHVEDVWEKLRSTGAPARTVNFITGPSKTADIEQTIQYGAHGPRSLDVVYISTLQECL